MTRKNYNVNSRTNESFGTASNIKDVENEIRKYIIGQDDQIKKIITAIYRSVNFKTIKSNLLIIGDSGTGKTETIKQIAKKMNIPYTIEDATKYTQEGYHGADVSCMLENLLENAGNNIKKAQKGIIIIDEIDKKNGQEDSSSISGVGVLNSLLKLIEGDVVKINSDYEYKIKTNFDTKDIIVIFMGAFGGLKKIRDDRIGANRVGFSTVTLQGENKEEEYIKSDLVKFGLPVEFVSRIDTIVEMRSLNKNDLINILENSKLSIFFKYVNELAKYGIIIKYDRRLFERIAIKSLKLGTGARELNSIINYIFEDIIHEVFANPGQYKECRLYFNIVDNNKKYKLS